MATRYWVGNAGALDDTTHWSATSGGGGSAGVPGAADTAVFDANSFSSAAQTVTGAITCTTINIISTDYAFNLTMSGTVGLLNIQHASITLTSTATISNMTVNDATIALGGDLTITGTSLSTNTISLTASQITTGGFNITAAYVNTTAFGGSNVIVGSTTITCNKFIGSLKHSTSHTVNLVLNGVSGSELKMLQTTGANVITNLTLIPDGTNSIAITNNVGITNELIMYGGDYVITASKYIYLNTGVDWTCNSTSLDRINISSSSAGTPCLITSAGDNYEVSYLEITDCTASGGDFIANYSLDWGGNTGWTIPEYETMFFMFGDKLYAWNGLSYQVYDGTTALTAVTGYRPKAVINAPPTGGGTAFEQINMLNDGVTYTYTPSQATESDTATGGDATHITLSATASAVDDHYNTATIRITWGTGAGQERTILDYDGATKIAEVSVAWVTNPDNTSEYTITGIPVATDYVISSGAILSVDKVTVDGVEIAEGAGAGKYTKVLTAPATVTFGTAPTGGVGSVEIDWTMTATLNRNEMDKYRYAIDYSGDNDYRMFIWGNPELKNRRRWSGLANGIPSAEYFETTAFDDIGNGEYAITDIVRHYSYQKIFLEQGVKYSHYDTVDIGGVTTAIFPVFELNDETGNVAPAQVKIVNNNAYSIYRGIHAWSRTNVREETNEKMISDRINKTLLEEDLTQAKTVIWHKNKEYWLHIGDTVWVYNYANDTFYTFDNIEATCFIVINDEMYFGTEAGTIEKFDTDLLTDNGTAISAIWQMGFTDCGVDYRYKNSYGIYVGARVDGDTYYEIGYTTEDGGSVANVACPADYSDILDFSDIDFSDFTFSTFMIMSPLYLDIPTKDFVYISYSIESATTTDVCTILSLTIPIRYSGKVY